MDNQRDLVLTLPQSSTKTAEEAAILRLHKPVVYQQDERGEKHLLAGTYLLKAATAHPIVTMQRGETPQVAFQIATYDASRPLIIDPVLSWATYLGGSGDENGNFPGTAGSAIQSTLVATPMRLWPKLPARPHRPVVPRRPCRLSCGIPTSCLLRSS